MRRARLVPTVGAPRSSKTLASILRPLMPPRAFHWSMASWAPLRSQSPSELSCPLCASTMAILIGPESLPPPPDDLPGVLHAVSTAAAVRTAVARTAWGFGMAGSSGEGARRSGAGYRWRLGVEGAAVDVGDVPVAGGGHRLVDHRYVEHRRPAAAEGGAQRGTEVRGRADGVAVRAAGPGERGEVRAVRPAVRVAELAAVAGAEAGGLQVGDRAVGPVVHHHEDHR